jgi:hypothetical protein
LLKLKEKLYKIALYYIIEPNYNPTKPNTKEVEDFSYEKARIIRSSAFYNRAEYIIHKAFPKARAFYYNLIVDSNRKMDVDDYEIEEEVVGESTRC